MVLFSTIVTRYEPSSRQQWIWTGPLWIYGVPLLPAATGKLVFAGNHTIYTPAAYVVTFARLCNYGHYICMEIGQRI
jgi:hypothetical protein